MPSAGETNAEHQARLAAITEAPDDSVREWVAELFSAHPLREDELTEKLAQGAVEGAATEASEPIGRYAALVSSQDDPHTLRPAELRCLVLIAEGHTATSAAKILHLSPHTVTAQLKVARSRVGARTVAHLVMLAIRSGQLEA